MNRFLILALSLSCGGGEGPAPPGHGEHATPSAPAATTGQGEHATPTEPAATTGHATHGPASASAAETTVMVSPAASSLLGLRVAPVRAGTAVIARRAPASVAFDPAATVRVTSQSGGQVRSLDVPAPGSPVKRGQILARVYDPSLRAILEELRIARGLADPWRASAAARARASGVPESDVQAVLGGADVPDTVAVRAPVAGVVTSRPVALGSWIGAGGLIVTLADPGAMLVDLVVAGPVPTGRVTLRDSSGTTIAVAAVVGTLPEANAAGVIVRVRPVSSGEIGGGRPITPGQPLVAEWTEETAAAVWVPETALVDTGMRRVVFVVTADGFVPRAVEVGARAGGEVEVRGVAVGESVATSAAFLLDSETQIGAMSHGGHGG